MEQTLELYLLVVFIAVVVISQTVLVSLGGTRAKQNRLMRERLRQLADQQQEAKLSLLRQRYLADLTPLARWLEGSELGQALRWRLQQAGLDWLAYRTVLGWLGGALLGSLLAWVGLGNPAVALLWPVALLVVLLFWMRLKTAERLDRFEEQFVEALDVMKRALLVGYPLVEVFRTVGEEMSEPIAGEFRQTYAELNFGVELRLVLAGLAERNPSVSMLAFISAVMIQKETGGNLAENLDKLGQVIRGRFRLYRKVRTLSAEGRMSAWVLALVPLGLFLALYLMQPDYLAPLVGTSRGHFLLIYSFVSLGLGLMLVKRILRIEV
ncbi:type II secretion system F family protein [Pseudaeromonas paramecii]|uniref:Type II secretion system F family protein n=1 Tax=Pseudaeromonas paramecii TaxID=2138166 RepID=A0ABP8QAW3_9GAMM